METYTLNLCTLNPSSHTLLTLKIIFYKDSQAVWTSVPSFYSTPKIKGRTPTKLHYGTILFEETHIQYTSSAEMRVFAGVAQPNVIIMYSIALVLGCNVLRVRQSILLLKTLIQIKTKHIFSSSYRDPF